MVDKENWEVAYKCRWCGEKTTQEDLEKYGECPNCGKPFTKEEVQDN